MLMKKLLITLAITIALFASTTTAWAGIYNLDIARQPVNVTGKPVQKFTINGTIPGPTLRFTEGEDVTINVTNHLDNATSIHWHGFLIPANMDGVPGFSGFPAIEAGKTFTYRFKIRQSGTYWYHAHATAQEQDGVYGSIAITPKGKDPVQADREYVVLLSDFTNEKGDAVMRNLKMNSSYYNFNQRTMGDFFPLGQSGCPPSHLRFSPTAYYSRYQSSRVNPNYPPYHHGHLLHPFPILLHGRW